MNFAGRHTKTLTLRNQREKISKNVDELQTCSEKERKKERKIKKDKERERKREKKFSQLPLRYIHLIEARREDSLQLIHTSKEFEKGYKRLGPQKKNLVP